MSHSQRQKIQDLLHKSDTYTNDKEFFMTLVTKYKNVPREKTYELDNIFTDHAIKNNWSRRKLDALLHEIVLDIKTDPSYSEDIYDLLTNYLDGLEGNCSWEAVTRLNNDPVDQSELSSYARSYKWMDEDFYSL